MIKIPKQLKDCGFCRVLFKTKKPFEGDWNNNPYTYPEISKFFPAENYGVLTGLEYYDVMPPYIKYRLGVLDDDTEDKQLMKIALDNFDETFQVNEHLYYKLRNWDGKKIIFFDKEGKHCGELQGVGQQVVGPGSTHPSGRMYEVKNDVGIVSLEIDAFKSIFRDYLPKKKNPLMENTERTDWTGDKIQDIPISNIISLNNLNDVGDGCYQGPHPNHGSDGGMNFRVNTSENTWCCYRCSSGGGPSELIGVMEGIINCNSAGSNCYSPEQGQQVIEVARDKYGLKKPEISKEPQGWALSVNIRSLAEDYKLIECINCNVPFEFNEKIGFYKCPSCKTSGGLVKFAKLCFDNMKRGVQNG